MPRVVAIVQARMGSARLPGKSLMTLAGRPMLAHVLERAASVEGVEEVVLATSVNERDTPLARLAGDLGFRCWRGSEHDVLGRYAAAAKGVGADLVMRITGDCPFTAPDVCQLVLQTIKREPWWDYVSNDTLMSGYPDGTDCEVFRYESLLRANAMATDHKDREHVTPWLRRHSAKVTVHAVGCDYRNVKLSVDSPEDLDRARRVFGFLAPGAFSFEDTLLAYRCYERGVLR